MNVLQSKYPLVDLLDLTTIQIGKTPSRSEKKYFGHGSTWVAISDMNGCKYIDSSKEEITDEGVKSSNIKLVPEDTLIYSFKLSIGKVAITGKSLYTNEAIAAFPIKNSNNLNLNYFYYVMTTFDFTEGGVQAVMGKTLNKKSLSKIQIPLPPLHIQQKIAEVLDKADAIRKRSPLILQRYDQLAQSTFLDMFGDPVKNEKEWEVRKLGDFGSFKNGLNYGKDDYGFEIKCIGVGDFKSKYEIDNFNEINSIKLSSQPSQDYLLRDGDLVFVRSNGNKDLVGRCVAVYPGAENVSFSGFCIRMRIEDEALLTVYLTQLFRNSVFKIGMLSGGRGANIQNINQQILSNLKLQIPPIHLQNQFATIIEQIEKQKAQTQQELNRAEELYQSLLQRAFKGELFREETVIETTA